MTNGKTANHRMVRLRSNFFKKYQTGYCTNGLDIVAKLICQARVDGVHCGPNAFKAELAIGFQARKMELCKNANIQNSLNRIHFFKPEKYNEKNLVKMQGLLHGVA